MRWTLARAHARTGDAAAVSGCLGSGPASDQAIARFADGYAGQVTADYDALAAGVRAGRVPAVQEGGRALATLKARD